MVDAIPLDEDWSHVHVPSILIEHANRLSSRSHLNGMESVVCLANAVDEGLGVILIAVLPGLVLIGEYSQNIHIIDTCVINGLYPTHLRMVLDGQLIVSRLRGGESIGSVMARLPSVPAVPGRRSRDEST